MYLDVILPQTLSMVIRSQANYNHDPVCAYRQLLRSDMVAAVPIHLSWVSHICSSSTSTSRLMAPMIVCMHLHLSFLSLQP